MLIVLVAMTSTLYAAVDEDDVRDDLEQRWFDIEVVIFERLDTFEYNTIEALTSTETPTWAAGLVEYGTPPLPPTAELIAILDPRCIGFPSLPEALAPHPILAALIEAERIAAELEETSLLGDTFDETDALNIDEGATTDDQEPLLEETDAAISATAPPASNPVLVAPLPTPDDIYEEKIQYFTITF